MGVMEFRHKIRGDVMKLDLVRTMHHFLLANSVLSFTDGSHCPREQDRGG
jgi:hypothetical protein